MPSPVYNNYANIITFSRGTNATLTDSTGKITYAPNNRLTYSQVFTNAVWTQYAAGSLTDNSGTAPDGTQTAAQFSLITGASSAQGFYQGISPLAAGNYTYSIYVKPLGTQKYFALSNFGDSLSTSFNLDTLQFTNGEGGSAVGSITALPNGWYRLSRTVATTGGAQYPVFLAIPTYPRTGGPLPWTPATAEKTLVWGAQLEIVTYQTTPSTYVATTTAAYYGPRLDYDPVTLAVKGLLVEEARTNLYQNSTTLNNGTYWAYNFANLTLDSNVLNPSGLSSWKSTINSGTSATFYSTITVTASASTTYSVYAKAGSVTSISLREAVYLGTTWTFNLSAVTASAGATITAAGNGWYRCSVPIAYGVGQTTGTVTMGISGTAGDYAYFAYPQAEAGSFATSYIPTTTASVARSADVASMTGSNFSSWYNPTQWTMIASYTPNTTSGSQRGVWAITDGTNSNYADWRPNGGDFTLTSGGVAQVDLYPGGVPVGNLGKGAFAASPNAVAVCLNGGSVLTDNTVVMPSGINQLQIGYLLNNPNIYSICGWIRSITYYPRRLSDAQIQALTT